MEALVVFKELTSQLKSETGSLKQFLLLKVENKCSIGLLEKAALQCHSPLSK